MRYHTELDKLLSSGIGTLYSAAVLHVSAQGRLLYVRPVGLLDPNDASSVTTTDSIFDIASLTKLFTAATFMRLVERQVLSLQTKLSDLFDEFGVPDKDQLTFVDLLTHTSGMPASVRTAIAGQTLTGPDDLKMAVLRCQPSQPPRSGITYSDVNFVILGIALERVCGQSLDRLVSQEVLEPLNLTTTCYNPTPDLLSRVVATGLSRGANPTRLRGIVHDPTARFLGGVSGHAGLFSCVADLATFADAFTPKNDGPVLLSSETVSCMTMQHAADALQKRALGWAIQSNGLVPGPAFSPRSFGHNGFTGSCLWLDPVDQVSVVLLANRVYFTEEKVSLPFERFRKQILTTSKALAADEVPSPNAGHGVARRE